MLGLIVACQSEPTDLPIITRDQTGIEQGKDVEIIYSDSARIRVRVTGPTMLYYTDRNEPKQTFPDGTTTYFYDDNQVQMSVLKGKYAVRDEHKKQVIIRDSVVWESLTDGRLETSELVWDEVTNVIKSTKSTKITRQNETIQGFNFETDNKLAHWHILSPVGTIKVPDKTLPNN